MKEILSVLLVLASVGVGHAAPTKSQLTSQQARRTATELFLAGRPAEAVAHLQTQLKPETGPDGARIAVVEGLIDVACSLYSRRRLDAAREVVSQAFVAADPIVAGSSPASASRRAALLSSLGMLCENVRLDLKQAEVLYRTAEALNPADPNHRTRKAAVMEKQKSQRG